MRAVDAIKASFELVTDNLGNTFVFWILLAIVVCSSARCCAASGSWSPPRWC